MTVENLLVIGLCVVSFFAIIVAANTHAQDPGHRGAEAGVLICSLIVWLVTLLALVAGYYHLVIGVSK